MTAAVADISAALAEGAPLHSDLDGGYLDIERPLPILLVHRARAVDVATPRLLLGHSSLLVVSEDAPNHEVRELIGAVARAGGERFGAFLLLELWAKPAAESIHGGTLPFRVVVDAAEQAPQPATILRDALEDVAVGGARAEVEVDVDGPVAPPGSQPVLDPDEARDTGCLMLGLEVPAVYLSPDGAEFYPRPLRVMRSRLSRALQRTFFEFIRLNTNFELKDHRELGRRNLVPAGSEIDQKLAAIGAGLEFLLHITPINTEAAFARFRASGFEEPPAFRYRLLPFDPDLLKRELYQLPIEDVTDPTLASLLREKRLELDRMITMLEDRDRDRFRLGSLQVYPPVDDELLRAADTILSKVPAAPPPEAWVEADRFAALAEREIERYRAGAPEIAPRVNVRDDMPGVMVSSGQLHLSSRARIAESRVEALIQHEVGTHVVTYYNGLVQPLVLLSAGLPGYEQTQEGLAMLSEYVSGGLEPNRLRLIAARVVAVDMMTRGAGFVEIFHRMHGDLELSPESAWSVTMRVTRGGGSSKDAIYLRGLTSVLAHLASGHSLDPLLIGKIAIEQVPLIEELLWRQVLKPPRLRPRWLEMDGAEERLRNVAEGIELVDLVEG